MEIHQKISVPKYQKLKTMVKRSTDQKLRLRNFGAGHGRIETGAVVKVSKGIVWRLKEEKVPVTSGKTKARVRKETVALSGMRVTIVPKNQTALPPHLPQPSLSRGRSVSRKRSIRGKSNRGAIRRQPCRYYLKRYLHAIALWILASSRVSSLQNRNGMQSRGWVFVPASQDWWTTKQKAEERQLFPQMKFKRRQECCGYRENCTTIGLRLARLGCVGFSKRQTVPGKPDAKSLGISSKSTVHSVHATSCGVSGKRRTIVGKNTSHKSSSAKSLRCEFWGPVPWGDWKTTAMCPKQGLEPC